MAEPRATRHLGLVFFVAILLVGCSIAPQLTTAPTPTANPWLEPAELDKAVSFRTKVGIQADLAWVRAVAQMPESSVGIAAFGIPLTAAELEGLRQRAEQTDAVFSVVETYGDENREEWAGATKDPKTGAVVARFTGRLAEHETALRKLLSPNARLVVSGAQWNLDELQAVFDRIHQDWTAGTWLIPHGIYPLSLGVDVSKNQVSFEVSSAVADLDALLERQYDAVGMLLITSDGTGVALFPKGTLRGHVVDAHGRPVVGVPIELTSNVPGAGIRADIGYATNAEGRFEIEGLPAVAYEVLVYTDAEAPNRVLLGSANVTVAANQTITVWITIH